MQFIKNNIRTNPAQWYSSQMVGLNTLKKTVGKLLKSAELDGFFTNHSLRRTGTTRLFQADVSRKLVKEFTGHRSAAVDQYQITSNPQHQQMSEILQKKPSTDTSIVNEGKEMSNKCDKSEKYEGKQSENYNCKCSCGNIRVGEASEIANIIHEIVTAGKGTKAKIKIEVEFCSD